MEENKEIKKKKMPLYLIAIAIVLAVLGVMDIKVNAAENQYLKLYYEFGLREGNSQIYDGWKYSDFDGLERTAVLDNSYSYALLRSDYISNNVNVGFTYVLYSGKIGGNYTSVNVNTVNNNSSIPQRDYNSSGDDTIYNYISSPTDLSSWKTVMYPDLLSSTTYSYTYISHDTNLPIFTSTQGLADYYATGDLSGQYKPPIDYDSLETDDNMFVPKDLKRNVLTFVDKSQFSNVANPQLGQWLTYNYDYVTWTNTSSQYQLQLQIVPIVQFYSQSLAFGNVFDNEFIGNWITKEVFEDITNSYSKNTHIPMVQHEDEESYLFYENCLNDYDTDLKTKSYLYFGYRIRYVDVDNLKAGPWLELIPTHTFDEYESNIRYSDDTTENNGGANGSTNTFDPNDTTLEDAKEQIDTENEFKDKYDVLDGNADVGEITNWLNSVTGFIKSSPSVIGSVLGFLPQPILYGLYITIFLGVFATAVGIIKALI